MKYIVQEPVLTTITDEDISDEKLILNILTKLKDSQQSFHLSYEDFETQFIRSLDNVRITNIHDNMIDIHAFLASANVKYKNIALNNIRKIRVISSKQDISKRHKVNRFQTMEVADLSDL